MAERRGWGEDGIFFEHSGTCRDAKRHNGCPGRWRGVVSLGYSPDGKRRIRRKVSGKNKTAVKDKLKELHADLDAGLQPSSPSYTLGDALDDWVAEGLDGRSEETIRRNRSVLRPVYGRIGKAKLKDLTAGDLHAALTSLAATRSTATISLIHNCLSRAIRQAEARDHVRRNVAALIDTPTGQGGRRSRSFTLAQAVALLAAAKGTALYAYIVVSMLVGVRTEEARALTWDHVDLEGDPTAIPPVPPHVEVWRSVRAHGDTKTKKSRRSLKLPTMAVEALCALQIPQADARINAGDLWKDKGLVFCTSVGTPLDEANVRREFRKITEAAGLGETWAPRELRHTFVSLLSDNGMAIEEISRLMGHSSTNVTETVYRHELRPVITPGAEVMDKIFKPA